MTSYRESHFDSGETYDDALSNDAFASYMDRIEGELLLDFVQAEFAKNIPRYLDFACGTGRITLRLETLATETWGVDISTTMLQKARQRCVQTTFLQVDLTKNTVSIPPIDLVTAFRFFGNAEHQLRCDALAAINRVLRVGGWLVINNHRNPHTVSRLLFRMTGGRHHMDLTMGRLRALLEDTGFVIRRTVPIGAWLVRDALYTDAVLVSRWARRLEAMTQLPALTRFAPDAVFIAQKARAV